MKYTIKQIIELMDTSIFGLNIYKEDREKIKKIAKENPELYKKAINKFFLDLSKNPTDYRNLNIDYDFFETFHLLNLYLEFVNESTLEKVKNNLRPIVKREILAPKNSTDTANLIQLILLKRHGIKVPNEARAEQILTFAKTYPDFINIEDFANAIKKIKSQEHIEKFEKEFVKKEKSTTV